MEKELFNSIVMDKMNIEIYNPRGNSIFPITSSIIFGEKEAILIDASFQKNDAQILVDKIKESGKKLTTVLITNSDPDYYFGLDTIKKNFPDVKILSTAQVAYLIDASKDDKLKVWGGPLGENAPSELITPDAIDKDYIEFEGIKIEIKQDPKDPDHSYLFIPEYKIVLGGIPIATGYHIWIADSQKEGSLEIWRNKIDEIKALNPSKIIPGHSLYTGDEFTDVKGLDEIKTYLTHVIDVKNSTKTSTEFIAKMKEFYPDLPGDNDLDMGAKVLTGEMDWVTLSSYPAINRKLDVKFGDLAYELTFKDNKEMSLVGINAITKNDKDTVQYKATEIANNVFMVYWSEPILKSNVVHIQDFNQNIVYTNISSPDGSFYNLKGTFEIK